MSLEKLQTKYGKVVGYIKYIKICKKERLIPTFAKVKISIKNETQKLRLKISLFVINTELENKNSEKRKLKKEINKICIELKKEFKFNHFKYRTSSNTCYRQKPIEEH